MKPVRTAPRKKPPIRETRTLLTLAAINFTHILDFMIMMPLGARLMREMSISPSQFGYAVAAYGLAAAISGFIGGFVIDRIERRRALLLTYAAFALATMSCALAPNFAILLLTRFAAGASGGIVGALGTAMVGDITPPHRRGRGMGLVMSAFPLASVAGIPLGLLLVDSFNAWHAPFWAIAIISIPVGLIARKLLPKIHPVPNRRRPWPQMRRILIKRVHIRCFALNAVLIFGGATIIPFLVPFLVHNVGIAEHHLKYIYIFSGIASFLTTNLFGRLADSHDKLRVFIIATAAAIIGVLIVTNLSTTPLWLALLATTFFLSTMSSRFPPASAMVVNAIDSRYRGGFMSVASAIQQFAGATANIVAGFFISTAADGRVTGFATVGIISALIFALAIPLAHHLRKLAPNAFRPGGTHPSSPVIPS